MYYIYRKYKFYFWQKYSLVSQKRCNPEIGQILRFSNGKVDNLTLINSFCAKNIPESSKLRGPEPYGNGKNHALVGGRNRKM